MRKIGQFKEPMESYHSYRDPQTGFGPWGSSSILEIAKTPAHFKCFCVDGVEKDFGKKMDIGTATHSAILEQDLSNIIKFEGKKEDGTEYVVARGAKGFKQLVEANPGKIVLTNQEYKDLETSFALATCNRRFLNMLEGGLVETSFYALVNGIYSKARPDLLGSDFIMNYKTTESELDPIQFGRIIGNMKYHVRANHEMRVVQEATGRNIKHYLFGVQMQKPPHLFRVFRLKNEDLIRGEALHIKYLQDIEYCLKVNQWPGYPDAIEEVEIPYYIANKEESESEQEPSFDVA